MNTAGAAASIAGAYMYISLYLYLTIYCTYTMYICYVCISVTSAFGVTTKSTRQLRNALYSTVQNILLIHTF